MADEKDRVDESPAKKGGRPNQSVLSDIGALAKGMATTFGEMITAPVTLNYPEDKKPRSERYRGRHYLRRYDNGLERCIGCELCAKTYEINMLRCIFCGYCEDACPVQAIVLGPEYELSDTSREKFIYTKERLLEPLPPDVQARLEPK